MQSRNVRSTTPNARLIDSREVREITGLSTRTIARLAEQGRMPAPVRLGALVRWPRAVIEGWIADGCPAVAKEESRGR